MQHTPEIEEYLQGHHAIIRYLVNLVEAIVEHNAQDSESQKTPEGWENRNVTVPAIIPGAANYTATQLASTNDLRRDITLVNQGANSLILLSAAGNTGKGTTVASGAALTLRTKGAFYCYSTSGTNVDVYETLFDVVKRRRYADTVTGNSIKRRGQPFPTTVLT